MGDTNYWGWIIADLIPPGESLSGMKFHSQGLAGIVDFIAHGAVPFGTNRVDETEPPDTPEGRGPAPGEDPIENAFHGKTVGPAILPDSLTDEGHLERLISQKDEAAALGWIQDPGIVTSLNKKLENALASLKRGNEKAAAGTLRAFLNELDALRGKKHLNENAYWLLRANAEFLIARLEAPWYKRMFR